jgi:hypothetical protein
MTQLYNLNDLTIDSVYLSENDLAYLPGILNVLKSLLPPMLLIMMPRANKMTDRLMTLIKILQK